MRRNEWKNYRRVSLQEMIHCRAHLENGLPIICMRKRQPSLSKIREAISHPVQVSPVKGRIAGVWAISCLQPPFGSDSSTIEGGRRLSSRFPDPYVLLVGSPQSDLSRQIFKNEQPQRGVACKTARRIVPSWGDPSLIGPDLSQHMRVHSIWCIGVLPALDDDVRAVEKSMRDDEPLKVP